VVATQRRHVGESFRTAGPRWEKVSARLDLAASNYRDGRDYESESIATVMTPELAYTVEIEHPDARVEIVASAAADELRFDAEPGGAAALSRDREARFSPGDAAAERRHARGAREDVPPSVRRDAHQHRLLEEDGFD
jgi:hypothetical protein